ncbi:hypothetical protein JCM10212_005113 [Sporobolomyces blumeae]
MTSIQLFDDDLDIAGVPAPAQPAAPPAASVEPATILVIASQEAAQDGSYQSLVSQLSIKGKVEMQMVDRVIEGAATLNPLQYSHVSLLLPSVLVTGSLLSLVEPALAQGGTLEVQGQAAESDDILGEIRLVGLASVNKTDAGNILATKAAGSSAPLSLKRPASEIDSSATASALPSASASTPSTAAVPLPTRTSRAAKASLWAFTTAAASSGAQTPTIDESSLLTEADLERPNLVKREDCDVKRTRKACKNCTCGLREILLDEKEPDDLVQAGFEAAPNATAQGASTSSAAGARKIKSGVTSSCGNCYLGDAFRCGSCPYLGMPAFEPGQKVVVSGMDDTI